MRMSDWSSDVCSSDLRLVQRDIAGGDGARCGMADFLVEAEVLEEIAWIGLGRHAAPRLFVLSCPDLIRASHEWDPRVRPAGDTIDMILRSEEHTSELQSLMRISYAVFCLKKKKKQKKDTTSQKLVTS